MVARVLGEGQKAPIRTKSHPRGVTPCPQAPPPVLEEVVQGEGPAPLANGQPAAVGAEGEVAPPLDRLKLAGRLWSADMPEGELRSPAFGEEHDHEKAAVRAEAEDDIPEPGAGPGQP